MNSGSIISLFFLIIINILLSFSFGQETKDLEHIFVYKITKNSNE